MVLNVSDSMLDRAALAPTAMSLNELMQSMVSCANPVIVDFICFIVVVFVTFGLSLFVFSKCLIKYYAVVCPH